MENIKCKTCGGSVVRSGNYYVCEWCRNKWEIDSGDDIHAVDRANAWSALRDGDFEKSAELFESIIVKEAKNHEAYWGRALALGGIIYVTDISENKKVPTCNNITEESFINSKDVQKAIALAPSDISDGYKQQAEYIEKIRKEWLEKASKEPAYDVFISFKDSDRENGIERTQDSIDAQDLYNALVAEGYKVFFSRISLRDKISEQYEPYIYNAIKTAKVMIVFGEKAEYFSSVWIKNEWTRFRTRIEKGEKHKNSLVVVYKNMNPGDLPVVLKSRQCLNAADMTFLSDLNKHIKRVVAEAPQLTRIDRIEIKGGQIAKKATRIENNSIQIREIGSGAVAQTSITEKQQLDLVKSYMRAKQWDNAEKLIDDILFNNPSYADAILHRLLCRHHVLTISALLPHITIFDDTDFGLIEKTLNCANKALATELLDVLYQADEVVSESVYQSILKTILPYNHAHRIERIREDFENAISKHWFNVFGVLLSTLNEQDVDTYIQHNLKYAEQTTDLEQKQKCIDAILAVDNGNIDALKMLLTIQWSESSSDVLIHTFEEILKYTRSSNREIKTAMTAATKILSKKEHCVFVKQLLKYYSGDLKALHQEILDLSKCMISKEFFDDAQYLLGIALTLEPENPEIYWNLCLVKTKASSERAVLFSSTLIQTIPEYTKYLTMVGEDRRQQCMVLAKKQERKQAGKKKAKKVAIILSSIAAFILLFVLAIQLYTKVIHPSMEYNDAVELMQKGQYAEAISVFSELGAFKDSQNKIKECKYSQINAFLASGQFEEASAVLNTVENDAQRQQKELVISLLQAVKTDNVDSTIQSILSNNESVSISYDVNGGVLTHEATQQYSTPNAYNGLSHSATKQGYRFIKWSLVDWQYDVNQTTHISLQAVWSDGYIINYQLNGGTAQNPDEYHKDGGDVTLNNPTRNGYTFIGWTGTDLTELTMSVTIPAGSYGNRAYMANWEANEYIFTLNANGGNINNTSISANYDSYYTLPTPTRDYYTFSGWYNGNTKYENGTWHEGDHLTLSAKWTPISYSITYNLSGGTNSSQNAKNFTVESSNISLKDPTKTGYKFIGWYKESSYSNKITEIAAGTHENISLYAKWEIVNYTITYELDGGTISGNTKTTFTINDLPLSLPTPSKSGFVFLNWSKETFDGQSISKITTVGNVSIVANYMDPYLQLQLSNDGTYYKVNDYAGSATKIVIPSYYNGKPIKEIGDSAFYDCSSLVTIQIPKTVNKIGTNAFQNCVNLKNINIPDGITKIAASTFSTCKSLASIFLPDSIKEIGGGAFYNCHALSNINLPSNITEIGSSAFYNCKSLKSINIPSGVQRIHMQMFYGCTSLTSVTIPNTVTRIDYLAFSSCSKLTKIIIPASVVYMEVPFSSSSNLTIYCRATAMQPEWKSNWNSSRPVIWGYTGN